jgi:hypothetical protein
MTPTGVIPQARPSAGPRTTTSSLHALSQLRSQSAPNLRGQVVVEGAARRPAVTAALLLPPLPRPAAPRRCCNLWRPAAPRPHCLNRAGLDFLVIIGAYQHPVSSLEVAVTPGTPPVLWRWRQALRMTNSIATVLSHSSVQGNPQLYIASQQDTSRDHNLAALEHTAIS